MATNPQDVAPGAAEENPELNTDPQPNPAPADGGEGEGADKEEQPGPYDALARDLGWVPKADFQGDPAQWRDAETFIRTGRDIQKGYQQELKALRSTVDNIGRTTAQVIEQETERRVAELARAHDEAVDAGDSKRAFEISQDILRAKAAASPPQQPGAEAQAFAERNKNWFKPTPQTPGGDPIASARAVELCNIFAAQGYDKTTQLELAEQAIRREFPHHFGQGATVNGKPAAHVNAPGSRAPQRAPSGPKGFADMPAESQKVATEMAQRLNSSPDAIEGFKKRFAENYWLQAGAKA